MTNQGERSTQASWRLRGWEWLALAGLVALFAAQALLASPRKSASFDEQYHLTAGYTYLRTGDYRLATNHPPLAGLVAALPLLARDDIRLPLEDPAWAAADRFRFSDVFLWESNDSGPELLVAARRPVVILGVLLLLSIFFWARQMLGAAAGWLALLLAAFDPNLIANARLVTTDLAVTLFTAAALWWLWRWLQRAQPAAVLVAGVSAGLAMASKYNALLVWPIAGLIVLVTPQARTQLGRRLLGLAAMAAVATITLWAVYAFDCGRVAGWPLPLPAPYYWENLFGTYRRIVAGVGENQAFFLGQVSDDGWWAYFPVALAAKTPLPTQIFFAAGLITMTWRRAWRRLCALWLPIVFFFALALSGALTIGYRHILPALPFLILVAAHSVELPELAARFGVGWRRGITVAGLLLCGWLVIATVRFFPDHEAYFAELAGPWTRWSQILVDSNLDWGQDLVALRERMDELGIEQVNLAYFGKAVPEAYGVRYRPLPGYLRFIEGREIDAYNPYTPEPGWYAISATSLRLGLLTPETVDLYAYFRPLDPASRAGYSIYLYQVDYAPGTAVARPVVLDQPLRTLAPHDLGVADGTRAAAKWLESPATTVYPQGDGFAADADPAFQPVGADFEGVFTLLGYARGAAAHPGQPSQLTIFWRVGERPMPQPAPTRGEPISAFVHLVEGGPDHKVAEFDGWDAALRGLEPGDIIAQQVTLNLDEDLAPGSYDLLVGLYSPQSWQRLTASLGGATRDHAPAGRIEVTP